MRQRGDDAEDFGSKTHFDPKSAESCHAVLKDAIPQRFVRGHRRVPGRLDDRSPLRRVILGGSIVKPADHLLVGCSHRHIDLIGQKGGRLEGGGRNGDPPGDSRGQLLVKRSRRPFHDAPDGSGPQAALR